MKELGLGIVFVILLCAMAASKGCAAVWSGPDDIASTEQAIDPGPPRPTPVRKAAPTAPKAEPRPAPPLTVRQARQASRCQGLNCGHDVRPHVRGHLPWRR